MSQVFNNLRIVPREAQFLDRRVGSRGEIFFDRQTNSLRIYDGGQIGGYSLAKTDLTNVSNSIFLNKAIASGVTTTPGSGSNFELLIAADDSTQRLVQSGNVIQFIGDNGISTSSNADGSITISNDINSFSTISVAGQTSIVADSMSDTLTFVAGSNIEITTNPGSGAITISATAVAGTASNSFSTISVDGQNNVTASSSSDTLTLVAGTGISITTDSVTDEITITNTVEEGDFSFDTLADVHPTGLTVDKIYFQAITRLIVSNSGASAYRFDHYGSSNNPTIYAINGTTIAFELTSEGHPFLIQTAVGVNYNTGLYHVSSTGVVSTGASAQGKDSGTLYWKIPTDISGGYRYQCSIHAPMVGSILIKDISTI